MQHIVPYTPQQNGVVEWKNHTLKEMANCMIQSKGPSLEYWAKAINCANYIFNRTLDVSHFHVLVVKHGLTFRMKNRKHYSLKVKCAYLLDILKM